MSTKFLSAKKVNTYNACKQQTEFYSYQKTNNYICICASPTAAHNWNIQRHGSQHEVQTLGEWQQQSSHVQQQPFAT
jgi:hypothetical protein